MGFARSLDRGFVRLALLGAALFLLPGSADAAFPGQNGKIVFASDRDDADPSQCWRNPECNWELYTVDPDGSNLQRLTFTSEPEFTPTWSADGRRIAFIRGRHPRGHVWVMNADGTGAVELTPGVVLPQEWDPAWSPDGRKIVYSDTDGTEENPHYQGIYVMNPDGSDKTLVSTKGLKDRHPAWSPNGERIAFTGNWDGLAEIWSVKPDGTDARMLEPSGRTFVEDPSWSPDSASIAFASDADDLVPRIYRMNADGTNPTVLAPAPGAAPAWSPDGAKIAFHTVSIDQQVWTMGADGSGPQPMTRGREPDWQPIPGPARADFKNAAHFCRAERDFLGEQRFRQQYGGEPNAFGRCVSGR